MPRACRVLAPREDQVLHLLAAQLLGALLAEHPADGVGDVALAAAVGADDGVDPGAEMHLGAVEEGLESVQLELLENHGVSLLRPVCEASSGDKAVNTPFRVWITMHNTRCGVKPERARADGR